MPGVGIVADTTACLPAELAERYGIEVVPLQLMVDGRAYLDGVDITPAEFYGMLPRARSLPTTSPSSPGTYIEAFRRMAQRSSSIVCITVSKALSAMFDSARSAAETAMGMSSGLTIEVVDSGTAAGADGWIVLAAARAAAAGGTHKQVVEAACSMKPRVHLIAVIDTLNYLAKGGRVPQVAAWASSVLQIKPVIRVVPEGGEVKLVSRPRTKCRAVDYMLTATEKLAEGKPLHAMVHHSNAPDEAEELKQRVVARFKCAEVYVKDFTPAMGVHTGPGLLGIAFYVGD